MLAFVKFSFSSTATVSFAIPKRQLIHHFVGTELLEISELIIGFKVGDYSTNPKLSTRVEFVIPLVDPKIIELMFSTF